MSNPFSWPWTGNKSASYLNFPYDRNNSLLRGKEFATQYYDPLDRYSTQQAAEWDRLGGWGYLAGRQVYDDWQSGWMGMQRPSRGAPSFGGFFY